MGKIYSVFNRTLRFSFFEYQRRNPFPKRIVTVEAASLFLLLNKDNNGVEAEHQTEVKQ